MTQLRFIGSNTSAKTKLLYKRHEIIGIDLKFKTDKELI